MIEFYFYLLIGICISLLAWGLQQPERVYQYPFFMGAIFLSFIVPQAIALINYPGVASPEAIERALLMSCLCAAMCWIGYQFKPNYKFLHNLTGAIDNRKLLIAATVLAIAGNLFTYLVFTSTPEKSLEVGGNWTGPITIYAFFSGLSNIAFPIFTILTLERPTPPKIVMTIFAGYPIFSAVFFAGRRQLTATFFILIGLSLFYVRRYLPPRWLVLTITICAAFLIPLLGSLRDDFWILLFNGRWQEINFQAGLNDVLSGRVLELRNAALLLDAAETTGQYGYGTGYWDSIVFRFIPGQLLGKDIKSALQFNLTDYNLQNLFGYKIPSGSTATAIGDTFQEFGFFGCLFFAAQAYFFKQLWRTSVYENKFVAQILYAGLISPALVGVTHGSSRFVQDGLFQILFVFLTFKFARQKSSSNASY